MGVLYNQVADQLQGLIRDGVYREGERLPGVRVLSRQFGVSISTVLQAHQTLEARGYLQARERSGCGLGAAGLAHHLSLALSAHCRLD